MWIGLTIVYEFDCIVQISVSGVTGDTVTVSECNSVHN